MHPTRRHLLLGPLALATALLGAAALAAAAVAPPPPQDALSLLVLDVGASAAGDAAAAKPEPGSSVAPPFVPQQDACAEWCRAVGACTRWAYCANPDGGCGSGCKAATSRGARGKKKTAAKQEAKTVCVGPSKDAWPHGLCTLLSSLPPPPPAPPAGAPTEPPPAPPRPLPSYATAEADSPLLAGFVLGSVPLPPACAAARASAAQCDACSTTSGSGDAPAAERRLSECLRCAEVSAPAAASVRVAVEEGRGTGAGAEAAASCATCWSGALAALGGEALARSCEQCVSASSAASGGCGRCLSALTNLAGGDAAERASQASERVGACLSCVAAGGGGGGGGAAGATNEDARVEGCVACASSRDPARCSACLFSAAANLCPTGSEDANAGSISSSSSPRGCIEKRDAEICRTCVDASQGAAAGQCSAAAARRPFSADVAACAALPFPERRAGCYACAAAAATAVGGCADCAGLPGDMDTAAPISMRRRRRRRGLLAPELGLEPAAFAAGAPAATPPNGTTAVNNASPMPITASPARDCAACLADPALASDEARGWCFACAARHRDDPAARAACFSCLRRPLAELTQDAERAREGPGGGDGLEYRTGAARRGRGGASYTYGDLCR